MRIVLNGSRSLGGLSVFLVFGLLAEFPALLEAQNTVALPIPEASKPEGESRRAFDFLMRMMEEAKKAGTETERKRLTTEFLEKSEPYLKKDPDQLPLWILRATASLELNRARSGWEAGQQLIRLSSQETEDTNVRKVMTLLEQQGWLRKDPPPAMPSVAEYKRVKELKDAYENSDGSPDSVVVRARSEFERALQKVAPVFPLLDPGAPGIRPRYTKLTLNRNGAGIDGFRFANTNSRALNLVWCFAWPERSSFQSWFIIPASGTMGGKGFETFEPLKQAGTLFKLAPWGNKPSEEAGGAEFQAALQTLPGGLVQPGKEYIIWFSFRDTRPVDIWVTFRLVPETMRIKSLSDQIHVLYE